ncbi:hypothetical protein ELI01_31570 (plasmid) [Rhizobium leguminosarum]|nr:hypothetical protein ELI01_31570 [Rhizobium leguminosarum]
MPWGTVLQSCTLIPAWSALLSVCLRSCFDCEKADMSPTMVTSWLGLREITGRGRFRAWGTV